MCCLFQCTISNMRKLQYFLLVSCIFITSCGEKKPEVVFNLDENLVIEFVDVKPEEEILNRYLTPYLGHESEKIHIFEVSGQKPLELTFVFKDKTNSLSAEEFEAVTNAINCSTYDDITFSHLENNHFLIRSKPSSRIKSIRVSCYVPGENSYYDGKFPGGQESIRFSALPENPLDEVIPLLGEMGYSPYTHFDRNMLPSIIEKYKFNESRDKYDLGFRDKEVNGVRIFWNESGITNIAFSVDDEESKTQHANLVSRLLNLDQEKLKTWMYSISGSSYVEDLNLGGYELSSNYDSSFRHNFIVVVKDD